MKRFSIEVELDEEMRLTISLSDGLKLDTFKVSGTFRLLEDEEKFYQDLASSVKVAVLNLAHNGKLDNFSITGNLGANK